MSRYKQIHLVPHTHWDREWYLPFETFRFRLVGLVDRLLKTMEEDGEYRFHLDGQSIILEDYLEIRPERRPDIERFVRNGQLTIGPWYVLMDEYLVSGESMIRNLEEGKRIGETFGPVMQVGYLPDTFGHIAQMPQILKQFGLEYAVVWRGLNGTPEQVPTEFEWEAPSGDRLRTIHLPYKYGYTSAMSLPDNPEEAMEKLNGLIADIGPHSLSGHVLLMNGFDHMEPQPHISALVAHWNKSSGMAPMKISSIPDFLAESMGAMMELPRLSGEFRRTSHTPGGVINSILPGVLSSRVYLKQQNARAQNVMEKWAEPLEALSLCLHGEHHPAFVRQAWKYILQNHPHDSICGCSIDEVHSEMETRFLKAGQIGEQLIVEALEQLAGGIDRSWIEQGCVPVFLFNSLPWRRDALAEIELDMDENTFYRSVHIKDQAGVQYDAEIVSVSRVCPIETYSARYPLSRGETNRHKIIVRMKNMPAMGYKLVSAKLNTFPLLTGLPIQPPSAAIENEYVRITAEADGALTWTDLATGECYSGLHRFEDGGDVGDEYSYSQPLLDERYIGSTLKNVSVKVDNCGWQSMKLHYELLLPRSAAEQAKRRSEDFVTLDVTVELTLAESDRTASFRTTVNNTARDHRLRLLFPLKKGNRPVQAGGHFDLSAREEDIRQPSEEVWVENEPTTFPFRHFLYADHADNRVIFHATGLHEYEWIPSRHREGEGTLAITLFRSVSHLGGGDRGMTTSNRPGPGLLAEGGQCLRVMTFEYGLTIGDRAALQSPWRIADEREISVRSRVLTAEPVPDRPLPGACSWLELDTPAFHATSLRPAVDGEGSIEFRVVNLAEEVTEGQVILRLPIQTAHETGLNGAVGRELELQVKGGEHRLTVILGPKEIKTIRLK
ncbi:alpha-mannosidase [Paenibacillus sp. GCM10027626]|uniref:alpha-mannosidase n=1 Tax=Paenibacillus sp. GCM10027626 TaxID=3273411 RepID=UPI0036389D49